MGLFHRRKKPERRAVPVQPAESRRAGGLLLGYQVATVQGQGTRERQEDSFGLVNQSDVTLIRENGLFLAVADGMGGMADGREASQTAISSLCASYDRADPAGEGGKQLRDMAVRAGEQVYQCLNECGGTTLVACTIWQELLNWVSVGDSYIFLQRGGGIYRINADQNYRRKLYRAVLRDGILDAESVPDDPDGHRLSSFLGMEELAMEPEYSRRGLRLLAGDTLLLCSDGVGGVLSDWELLTCMQHPDPQDICRELELRIEGKQNRYQDNYTAIAVRCDY